MRRFFIIVCLALSLSPLVGMAQRNSLPPVNPAEVVGDIAIAGTPILAPVINNLSTQFGLAGYTGNIRIDASGTANAMQQLCMGTTDIVLASRQILPQEAATCSSNGYSPVAFRVATSAVIVAVSRQNDFATNVSSAELQQIFGSALTWSEIRSDWPGDPIDRFGMGTTSDEFALFGDVVFNGDISQLSTAVGARYNDDPNVNLQSVTQSPTAIGFFDANFVLINNALLTGVAIDGILPTFDNIIENVYPLSRPLLMYTTSQSFTTKPQVADFLNYAITNFETEAGALGLFAAPANALDVAVDRWFAASGLQPVVQATPTFVPTPVPAVTEQAPELVTLFPPEVLALLVGTRLDLEVLATSLLNSQRPVGWSGSLAVDDPQLPLLIRLDLELLAARFYGVNDRPDDWFGAVSSTQLAIARDIRHDLELLADDVLGINNRPNDWAGLDPYDPLLRCDRSTQALVNLLENNNLYFRSLDPLTADYCQAVAMDVARFVEINLLNPDVLLTENGVDIPSDVVIGTDIAVAFYDSRAGQRAGVIPFGTGVTPIARSYSQFSNMTLVEGEDFLLFIEWGNMNITREDWLLLPNEADLEYQAGCALNWCD